MMLHVEWLTLGLCLSPQGSDAHSQWLGLYFHFIPAHGDTPSSLIVGDPGARWDSAERTGVGVMYGFADGGEVLKTWRGAESFEVIGSTFCTVSEMGAVEPTLLLMTTHGPESVEERYLSAYDLETGDLAWRLAPQKTTDHFFVRGIGDVTGDGFEDVAFSVRSGKWESETSSFVVIDGRQGEVAARWNAPDTTHTFRGWCAVGDVNSDSRGEIALVGMDGEKRVWSLHLLSAIDGELVRTWEWPDAGVPYWRVPVCGDYLPEPGLEIVLPYRELDATEGTVSLRVHSLTTGEVLLKIEKSNKADWRKFGSSMAILERSPERPGRLFVGAHQDGVWMDGAVYCYDESGAQVWKAEPKREAQHLGMHLGLLDDVDGDGVRDLAASEATPFNASSEGRVVILSGRTGEHLRVIDAEALGRND